MSVTCTVRNPSNSKEHRRLAHHAVAQLRDRRRSEVDERGLDPAADRRLGVVPEVVVIDPVDRVEQRVELAGAGGRLGQLPIHTLTSESSRSTSSGLAM
jgi:hypothetical protein